jgi:crotonobetainyl-CoA:carnitine CoA-transferase CaiB-like acyl-CoA transferase
MLRARDGWIALNLARAADVADLPAWLEADGPGEDPWHFAARQVAQHPARALVERARWLGLAVASADEAPPVTPPWFRIAAQGPPLERRLTAVPLVVDLSGLWAGPLCAHLLACAGARVIKVESHARPDGARGGPRAFFDRLHAGAASVALDFGDDRDLARLRGLLERADIVLESARPRALAQLGIDAAAWLARRPGLTWLSVTGYGRADPAPGRVAFGDDAGVAAGLALPDPAAPLFCGDAIADPLTGLHAAVAARASWLAGGGQLLDLSLRDVAAHAARFAPGDVGAEVSQHEGRWQVRAGATTARVAPPRARPAAVAARGLGDDTERICAELALPC